MLDCSEDGGEFHLLIRRVSLATAVAGAVGDHPRPASRAGVSGTGAVGVDDDLLEIR
jgi:hypothetical protein